MGVWALLHNSPFNSDFPSFMLLEHSSWIRLARIYHGSVVTPINLYRFRHDACKRCVSSLSKVLAWDLSVVLVFLSSYQPRQRFTYSISLMAPYKEPNRKYVHYSEDSGYGYMNVTWKQAKLLDNVFTNNDVKKAVNSLNHRQVTAKVKVIISFVSPRPSFGIEIDRLDMEPQTGTLGFRCVLVGIDDFTKRAWVCPLHSKTASDLADGAPDIRSRVCRRDAAKRVNHRHESQYTNKIHAKQS